MLTKPQIGADLVCLVLGGIYEKQARFFVASSQTQTRANTLFSALPVCVPSLTTASGGADATT